MAGVLVVEFLSPTQSLRGVRGRARALLRREMVSDIRHFRRCCDNNVSIIFSFQVFLLSFRQRNLRDGGR